MLNQCQFIGHLGADPDCRSTQSGDKIANLSIAVTEKWKDRDGNKQERTEWIRASVFGPLAGVCESYLKKGSKVFISGQMRKRKWEKDGTAHYTTEIILSGPRAILTMLDGKSDGGGEARGDTYDSDRGYTDKRDYSADLDDTIPF
jgi:single-strand DNA-binding protein